MADTLKDTDRNMQRRLAQARAERDAALAALNTANGILTRMVNYRNRNVHNFQLEKFDDFIHQLEQVLDQ